ncbi:MAG: FHA domain-containing protein [bacterium]|nr:FHA domain-containing protein [bacterium]
MKQSIKKKEDKEMFGTPRKTCKKGHLMDPSWDVCPICLAPVCGWLVVLNGDEKNKVYTIYDGKSKIGSGSDCEIRILLDSISRHHALLIARDGEYSISDLSSVTGTYLNNNQITSKDIIDGDIIRFGDVEFKFKCL